MTGVLHKEQKAGVLTLILNRPDKLNAFTRTMRDELIDAFGRADADDEVRAALRDFDPDRSTPIQALQFLQDLKQRLK